MKETDQVLAEVVKHLKAPVLGSNDWYLQEIVDSYFNQRSIGYQKEVFGPYSVRIFYCSADQHTDTLDCKHYSNYIGKELLVKINYTPHWYRLSSKLLNLEAFKLYQWLLKCKHQGISIARNSEYWLQVVPARSWKLKATNS